MKESKVYGVQGLSGGLVMRGIFVLLFSYSYVVSFSQAASPYSRFGLGYVYSPVFSANKAMGEIAAPYASAININYANPASYASLTRTTIEVGMKMDGANIHTQDSNYRSIQPNISHIAVAFAPNVLAKKKNWGISLGLLPYTNINYTFIQNYNDSALGPYRLVHAGKGSLYQAYVGGAYKVKGLSIGANLGFLFGKLDYQKTITFPDSLYAYSTRNITSVNAKSFMYTIGLQYEYRIYHNKETPEPRTDINMIVGAYGSGGLKLNAKVSNYWDRFYIDPTFGVVTIDTAQANFNQKESIKLPFNMGAGVMFGNELYWMLGADFKFMNWKSYSSPLNNGGLNNSWRISIGGQITPNIEADRKKYFSKVQYRLGGYYGKSELNYNGKQLSEAGGTVGFGFPFKSVAHLNLSGDFGSRGVSDPNAIRETYYRVTFGFVLNDIWFTKRKFD
ncbi:MAG TPA: hypothetical protein VK154_09175 [Chitinophagales bacterium]|nr:hypothetical protein [Chitinophagales bacterium]